MATLQEIEKLTREFARDQGDLRFLIEALQAEVEDAKRRSMKAIRRAVERAKTSRATLHTAVSVSADLFVKPRTVVIEGIKVGFKKGAGAVDFDDAEKVCDLIHKHLPELEETLVNVIRKPIKAALAVLPAQDLKRIGVRVEADGDVVVIQDTIGDVGKLVDALLKEEVEE